jgi:hypothetical protein
MPFITNGSSVLVHNYPFYELIQDYNIIEKKLYRGYVVNSPYGNSISFEKMLKAYNTIHNKRGQYGIKGNLM